MQIGDRLEIPGIRGVADLACDLPAAETGRLVKVYMVPEAASEDRYYVSITPTGALETVPPSRAKDTVLLVEFSQDNADSAIIHFVHEEVANA